MKDTLKIMKDTLIVVLICLLGSGVLTTVCMGVNALRTAYDETSETQRYALTTQVVEIDEENDAVVVEDFNGNLWEFYGIEDWQVGDCASLIMNSRDTVSVEDDRIEDARYSAWTLAH